MPLPQPAPQPGPAGALNGSARLLRRRGFSAMRRRDVRTAEAQSATALDDAGAYSPDVSVGAGTRIEEDVRLGRLTEPRAGSRGGLQIGTRGIIRRGSAVHDGVHIGDR